MSNQKVPVDLEGQRRAVEAKAVERHRKMTEAITNDGFTTTSAQADLSEEDANIKEAFIAASTNYGTRKLTEDGSSRLKPSSADPNQRNMKPMRCTQCKYHGEPANDGKCKECGAAMTKMMTGESDGDEQDEEEPEGDTQQSIQPDGGVMPGDQGQPPMGAPGGAMPPGEPDDGKDDDFDASDQPEVGEMVAYLNPQKKPRAGRVMLVFHGEAVVDTGSKSRRGEAITDKVNIRNLWRIPHYLEESAAKPTPLRLMASIPPARQDKSKAKKLIEQVAANRRSAKDAVEAMLGRR